MAKLLIFPLVTLCLLQLASSVMAVPPATEPATRASSGPAPCDFTDLESPVLTVALSPDSCLAAAGMANGNVVLFDLVHGRRLPPLGQHAAAVSNVAFSRDGKRLVSLSAGDGRIRIWDVASRQLITIIPTYHRLNSLAVSSDGSMIATGSQEIGDEALRVWDVNTQKQLSQVDFDYCVNCVRFTPDDKRVMVCVGQDDPNDRRKSIGSSFRVYELNGQTPLVNIPMTRGPVTCAISSNGLHYLVEDEVSDVHIFDAKTFKETQHAAYASYCDVSFSDDGQYWLANFRPQIVVMDRKNPKHPRTITWLENNCHSVALSGDGHWALMGGCGAGSDVNYFTNWHQTADLDGVWFRDATVADVPNPHPPVPRAKPATRPASTKPSHPAATKPAPVEH